MTFVSYAQNFEDVILWRALGHIQNGFYIDIGANDPVLDSVSHAFYQRGWTGISVEPMPDVAEKLRQARPHERIVEAAVSASQTPVELFCFMASGWTTGARDVAKAVIEAGTPAQSIFAQPRTLASLLEEAGARDIHWMKIDVEGMEREVLETWSNHSARPWVVVVESIAPHGKQSLHESWEPLMSERGYRFVYFDGLNRFYVHEDHEALTEKFKLPPNFFDDFTLSEFSPFVSGMRGLLLQIQEKEAQREHLFGHALGSAIAALQAEGTTARDQLSGRCAALEEQICALNAQLSSTQQRAEDLQSLLQAKTDELAALNATTAERMAELDRSMARLVEGTSTTSTGVASLEKTVQSLAAHHAEAVTQAANAVRLEASDNRVRLDAQLAEARARLAKGVTLPLPNFARIRKAVTTPLRGALSSVRMPWSKSSRGSAPIIARPKGGTAAVAATRAEQGTGPTLYYYVDHTIGCPVNTGVQRVVRGLARGLMQNGQTIVFVRWSRALKKLVLADQAQLRHLAKWTGPEADLSLYPAAEAEEQPIAGRIFDDGSWLIVPEVPHINHNGDEPTLDIIIAAQGLKLKTGFIFYDSIPLKRKEFAEMSPRHESYMRALLMADYVAPISNWSGEDLRAHLVLYENAALDTGPCIEPLLLPATVVGSQEAAQRKKAKKPENLILAVGTIEQRKNQGALLDAFELFSKRHPGHGWRLELAGNLHPNMSEQVQAATSRNPAIAYRGNISDESLVKLYQTCALTVFASVEEGFGLPIVESLSFGKPCICANFGAMAEAGAGGGCEMIDIRSPEAIADALERLVFDTQAYEALAQAARQRKVADWREYATAFKGGLDTIAFPPKSVGRVYYFIDQTAAFGSNTGIQRVVRCLGRAMQDVGNEVVPVKWDMRAHDFAAPSAKDLDHLANWNGPATEAWQPFEALADAKPGEWLLIPEVLSSPAGPQIAEIHRAARARGLRVAWIFYDAIPYKLTQFYPPQATEAHGDYMRAMQDADLILAISQHAKNDLAHFLQALPERTINLYDRVITVPLPAEFSEVERSMVPKTRNDGTIRILSVGTIEPRKNHLALVSAFKLLEAKLLPGQKAELTLVGIDPFPDLAAQMSEAIRDHKNIRWIKKAGDQELQALYREADFTVYPSLEEGFGLPIMESLWNARPCICRNSGSMAEIAVGGGCILTDVTSPTALADDMFKLVADPALREKLAREAIGRPFASWQNYATSVLYWLANERIVPRKNLPAPQITREAYLAGNDNLAARPLLSVCITTYNRADWIDVALRNLFRLLPTPHPDIEIVVCDNTSPDDTPERVKPYLSRPDFRYYRNPENVGMLGNLRVTAHHARGEFIWVLGDDDLAAPGSIENILDAIKTNRDAALIYLNYSYTREDNAKNVTDLDAFFASATPIIQPTPNRVGTIAELSTMNENFFTAIYCLVFRRDHALRAYSQNTEGRPFSTMLTCIPTTYHMLNRVMHEKGVWLGTPQLVVNMNVSWLRYASVWILERIPEALELAEKMGASSSEIDKRKLDHLPSLWHWFREILKDDPEGNRAYFDPKRMAARFKHLDAFREGFPEVLKDYEKARRANPAAFPVPTEDILPPVPTWKMNQPKQEA
ncbi:MAG: FkbM family methyltransferase [Proteobacteria bacterium]|nr:FkbM family methyltransferase [Pseudomonadota bacterium]